jgi:hypothetical protein
MNYLVYGLCLRTDKIIRYIGSTTRSPSYRLKQHFRIAQNASRLPVSRWIKHNNYNIDIIILHEAKSRDEMYSQERKRIASTSNLLNTNKHKQKHVNGSASNT